MNSLHFLSPAMLLGTGSIVVLLGGLWIRRQSFLLAVSLVSLLGAAALFLGFLREPPQAQVGGLLVLDPLGLFFAIYATLATSIAVIMGLRSEEIRRDRRAEYCSLLLVLCLGLVLMGITNHLLVMYLAIETVSILSYTLAGFHRENRASVEASLKYVVYGSMASAVMLFGMSLLFGVSGSLELTQIRNFLLGLPTDQIPMTLWISALFVFAGIAYKISAAPMHMWTPDVYEGSPTPVSALFSVGSKAAGFALLMRFFLTTFTRPIEQGLVVAPSGEMSSLAFDLVGPFNWPRFLLISAIFTMFAGNLAALNQTSVKRILGYSSIAHAGYMLMGASTQSFSGLAAILFYLMIYGLMNLGAFWVVSKVEDTFGGDQLTHFRGLGSRRPFYAVVMAIFLFSLIGLPPFAGFLGKYYLFAAVIAREMYGLAVLGVINTVISLYFYIKIAKAMFLEEPEVRMPAGKTAFDSRSTVVFLVLLAIPNVVLVFYWEPVIQIARKAVFLFSGSAG